MNYTYLILGILMSISTVYLWYLGFYVEGTQHIRHNGKNPNNDFDAWAKSQGITYRTSEEYQYRRQIFEENRRHISELLSKHKEAQFDLNSFSDLTHQEFQQKYLGLNLSKGSKSLFQSSTNGQAEPIFEEFNDLTLDVKDEVDYRTTVKYVVKNQLSCGSCWAFSTVTTLEYKSALNITLSPQNLVDCDSSNGGCQGGWFSGSFSYTVNKGIHRESDYPYKATQGTCQDSVNDDKVKPRKFIYYEDFSGKNCTTLKQLVSNYGAASVAVLVGGRSEWMYYRGGVISEGTQTEERRLKSDVDHAVVVVGYTKDYWIIQNSWGAQWGESGFIRVKMGNEYNICVAGYGISTSTQDIQNDYNK